MKSLLRALDRRWTKGRLFLIWRGVVGERYRTIQRMTESPILIGGCRRSGTTLLLSLLSAHPDIYAVPHETTAFSPGCYGDDIDLSAAFNIDFLYDHLRREDVPLEEYRRWCEKSPMNVRFAERALQYFGDEARFLHIVRDGRDVVTSRHPNAPNQYFVPPERWIEDVSHGHRVESHPRVMTIRYEDLVADHVSVMEEVCTFVGESFEEKAFRAYPDTSQFQESSAWFGTAREVNASSVGRWKKDEHRAAVEDLVSRSEAVGLLTHYGYID